MAAPGDSGSATLVLSGTHHMTGAGAEAGGEIRDKGGAGVAA